MEESLTSGRSDAPPRDGAADSKPAPRVFTLPPTFGEGPTALFTVPLPTISTRLSVIILCTAATATQLAMRSCPYVAVLTKDGMKESYHWDVEEVGYTHAAFGWGYSLTQIPGSMLAQHYGHKDVWLICLTGAAVMNMLIPLGGAVGGLTGVCICRFMFGAFQGPLFPIQTGLLAAWLHEAERSRLNAVVGCFWSMSQAIQSLITPYFMTGPGWEWAFLFYSVLVFIWAHYWKRNGVGIIPGEVARCSEEEAKYLSDSRQAAENGAPAEGPPPFSFTIWLAVLRQPVVWGMTLFTVLDGMGKPVYLTYVVQYLVTELDFDIESAGAIGSLPFMANFCGSLIAGFLADHLHNKGLSNVLVRRIFTMIPQVIYMLSALLLANGIGVYLTIFLLILAQISEGFSGSGIWIKSLDISKRYSSLAHGIMNGCGNVTYYALSASMIGTFLKRGGIFGYTLAHGKCVLDRPPAVKNTWSFFLNETHGAKGCELGEAGCVGFGFTQCDSSDSFTPYGCISETCSTQMDQCMKDETANMVSQISDTSVATTDADLCRETWNQLFLMSGSICMVAGVCFWVLGGAEEIDSAIDPIAVEVARKRGWQWGTSLGLKSQPGTGGDSGDAGSVNIDLSVHETNQDSNEPQTQ